MFRNLWVGVLDTHTMPDAARIQGLIDAGQTAQAVEVAQAALRDAQGARRASLLLGLASAHIASGRLIEGIRASVAARDAWQALNSREGECDALLRVATALRSGADQAAAINAAEQAEAIARAINDPHRLAMALRLIGISCSIVGRHQQGVSELQEALDLMQSLPQADADLLRVRMALLNARAREAESLAVDSPQRTARCLDLAEQFAALAQDCERANNVTLTLMARGNQAIMLRQGGCSEPAIEALKALAPEYQRCGLQPNVALCHLELGHASRDLGRHAQAVEHYHQALALLRHEGSLDDLAEALDGLSHSEEAQGHTAEALSALREWCAVGQRKTDEAARAAGVQRELRMELARLTHQWAKLATQDPLTGLHNRRALTDWMNDRQAAVQRGEPLSLVLLDLDHFKQINDRFGHGLGDRVLQRVAEILRGHCRHNDMAVRYGGEEFLLAVTSVEPAQAVDIAHRLREAVCAQDWQQMAEGLRVSVSIGVAQALEVDDTPALLTLADQRLYAAKYAGRDRVVAA
jgi:diguanylate cyclase (GGDEF)-like protein